MRNIRVICRNFHKDVRQHEGTGTSLHRFDIDAVMYFLSALFHLQAARALIGGKEYV